MVLPPVGGLANQNGNASLLGSLGRNARSTPVVRQVSARTKQGPQPATGQSATVCQPPQGTWFRTDGVRPSGTDRRRIEGTSAANPGGPSDYIERSENEAIAWPRPRSLCSLYVCFRSDRPRSLCSRAFWPREATRTRPRPKRPGLYQPGINH